MVFPLLAEMGSWQDVLDHWASLGLADFLTLLYWIFLATAVIVSNNLFADFVASKPDGRKTAIGKLITSQQIM